MKLNKDYKNTTQFRIEQTDKEYSKDIYIYVTNNAFLNLTIYDDEINLHSLGVITNKEQLDFLIESLQDIRDNIEW